MSVEIKDLVEASLPSVGDAIVLLPANFAQAAKARHYPSSAASFEKFARGKLAVRYASEPESVLALRSADWFAPVMLLSAQLIKDNPTIVSILCNLLSAYIYDHFKGKPAPDIDLRLVCEKTESSTHVEIHYKGSVGGMTALPEIVKSAIGTRDE